MLAIRHACGGLRSQSLPLKTPLCGVLPAAKRGGRGFKSLLISLQQKMTTIWWSFLLVRQMGLEPIRSRTRPSNVPVCQFQHCRAPCKYSRRKGCCQSVLFKFLSSFFTVLSCLKMVKRNPVFTRKIRLTLSQNTVSFKKQNTTFFFLTPNRAIIKKIVCVKILNHRKIDFSKAKKYSKPIY